MVSIFRGSVGNHLNSAVDLGVQDVGIILRHNDRTLNAQNTNPGIPNILGRCDQLCGRYRRVDKALQRCLFASQNLLLLGVMSDIAGHTTARHAYRIQGSRIHRLWQTTEGSYGIVVNAAKMY